MNHEHKPALLVIFQDTKRCEIERAIVFESHLDAIEAAKHFKAWSLLSVEYCSAGGVPDGLPELPFVQEALL